MVAFDGNSTVYLSCSKGSAPKKRSGEQPTEIKIETIYFLLESQYGKQNVVKERLLCPALPGYAPPLLLHILAMVALRV